MRDEIGSEVYTFSRNRLKHPVFVLWISEKANSRKFFTTEPSSPVRGAFLPSFEAGQKKVGTAVPKLTSSFPKKKK